MDPDLQAEMMAQIEDFANKSRAFGHELEKYMETLEPQVMQSTAGRCFGNAMTRLEECNMWFTTGIQNVYQLQVSADTASEKAVADAGLSIVT